jgi:hypothetical protein
VIAADVIPPEATVADQRVRRVSLRDPGEVWARAALEASAPDRRRCLAAVTASSFNLATTIDRVLANYESGGCEARS